MNQIEKLHLDAIDDAKGLCFADLNEKQAASKSAAITEQIAIEFANWIHRNYKPWQGVWMPTLERIIETEGIRRDIVFAKDGKLTEELFQEFLKQRK